MWSAGSETADDVKGSETRWPVTVGVSHISTRHVTTTLATA